MKAYTDLEQSKKLSEFLSLESADGFYAANVIITEPFITYLNGERNIPGYKGAIPCWSLAALLELMPDKISINNESYYLSFTKKSVAFRGPITWDGQKAKSFEMDNILDAVFEMVCWLKENEKI